MTDTNKSPDPVGYPTLQIGATSYQIKITCGTLLRLKALGVDLYEQPPRDPQNVPYNQALAAMGAHAAASDDPPTAEQAAKAGELLKEAQAIEKLMSQERRDWRPPLDRGTLTERLDVSIKIIAAALSTKKKPVDWETFADELELSSIPGIFKTLTEAVKKASAQI